MYQPNYYNRNTSVEVDQGYVRYIIVLQHRSSWQDIGALLSSKAEIQLFCLELSKKLGISYTRPVQPVKVTMSNDKQESEDTAVRSFDPQLEDLSQPVESEAVDQVMKMFKKSA